MAVSPVNAGSLVGERLGKYHLLALIAIGGTAEIYLARIGGEAGFEKYVVVKCLLDHLADDTDFVRMFLDEARLCAQLDHSNIVQTLELGQHEGRYYMVMEHLAGMSLAQLARKTHERVPEGVIPTRLVLGLAAQACAGLHYAHQRTGADGSQLNVVHRDVSPQNLVVTFEGMLKIVDFGIAKADLRQTHTRSGTIKGKFAYMSPEQCLAEPIDRRTDVFALGTVVHELLTARRLFKRANTYETYQAILKGSAPPPSRYNPTIGPELDQVVLRALAYQKEDRFESTEAFGEAMLGWLHTSGQSVSATDVSRYVEKVCAQELEEHAAHMRELISGHRIAPGETMRWDSAAEEAEAESLSLGASPLSSDSAFHIDISGSDYDEASSQIEERSDSHDLDDDFGGDFAGDTQIELDPMERVAALEAEAARFQVPSPGKRQAGKEGRDNGRAAPDRARAEGRAPGKAEPGRKEPPARRSKPDDRTVDRALGREPDGSPASDPAGAGEAPARNTGTAAGHAPGPADFPSASLRRGADRKSAEGSRRSANEPTAPEMQPGVAPHDQLTIPASSMVSDADRAPGESNPIGIYETPPPVSSMAQMWGDDSAEVLRHGRPAPSGQPSGPQTGQRPPSSPSDRPEPAPLHARPTLLRPPPGLMSGPVPMQGGARPGALPVWVLAVAFLVSAGLGLGLTVLIGSLLV